MIIAKIIKTGKLWAFFAAVMLLSASVSKSKSLPSPANTAVKCRTSTLTEKEFVEMIHAIATHRNLADVSFIEKTLQMKLKHKIDDLQAKKNPNRQFYYSGFYPLSLYLSFDLPSRERKALTEERQSIDGTIQFNDLDSSASFRDCEYVTGKLFDQTFGGTFTHTIMPIGSGGASQKLDGEKADRFSMYVQYSFSMGSNVISSVSIYQRAK